MSYPENAQVFVLAAHATSDYDPSKIFKKKSVPLFPGGSKDAAGKILVRIRFLSNDPAQREWIRGIPEEKHYTTPIKVGDVMKGWGYGEVVESFGCADYKKGDIVYGIWGWRDYRLEDPAVLCAELGKPRGGKLDKALMPPAEQLALGGVALTAYFGLLHVAKATKEDKVVVVSGAAGATGSLVAQIAKNVLGVKTVIGIAGGEEKCKLCKEQFGCDVALDYKSASFAKVYQETVDQVGRVDVYFDNTAGPILNETLMHMNRRGRIVSCGAISAYDDKGEGKNITDEAWKAILFQRLKVQGFIVSDPEFLPHFGQALKEIHGWFKDGKLKPKVQVYKTKFDGLPNGMKMLLEGKNTGKLVTEIID